jgi:GR25 family glycosyltransferase involved in LPS biosynthesis
MKINEYFDKVYVLNLNRRKDRLETSTKKLEHCKIEFERFAAVDGSVFQNVWETFNSKNHTLANPNYLACAISHLSIYQDALDNGYSKILIIEDDVSIRKNANDEFSNLVNNLPEWELLYFGFIPLSDDRVHWTYREFDIVADNLAQSKNFWGLYGYGISSELMKEVVERYNKDFSMELDRFFVKEIQPRGKSYGIIPQIFAAEDGYSDNSLVIEHGMMERSIDGRFGKLTDYI